tara:strand:+ start:1989 stop:2639 length:651 start_codon:yes stop_codon:yes gene_type:complete
MNKFIENYAIKSRHHQKLINFLYPELIKIKEGNILEFGVSDQAMSTELFINYSVINGCKVYSIDNVDYSNKFNNKEWNFILSRDDEYDYIKSKIPNEFSMILLDTIHEAKHVKKIIYNYFKNLKINSCFFIDDISWLPYIKNSDKDNFYGEVNNFETFNILLEIFFGNRNTIDIEFNFQGTGMCKIKKLNDSPLREPKKIVHRQNSFKNLLKKILK